MKAVIAYGTGRGTTAQIAEAIAEGMKEAGVDATAISVEYAAMVPARVAATEILGIGSPVHFYREARYLTNFLSTLPRLEGKRAFVFCTCGMDRVGETLNRLHGTLVEYGASVVGAESFRSAMSYYPLRKRGLGNGDDLPDTSVLESARKFGGHMARARELNPMEAPQVSILTALKARLLGSMRFRGLFFPGIRLDITKCTGYGQCMSRCLSSGLVRNDGETIPYVTDQCVQCLECVSWCPRGAIEPDSRFKEWLSTLSSRLGIH
jgi:flavodoxin/ferredoxin